MSSLAPETYGAGRYGFGFYGEGELAGGRLFPTSVTLNGVALDLADVLADITIRHGRTGYFDSASASTLQLTVLGVTREFTRSFRLGLPLVLNASDGSTIEPRFTGRLTDAALVDDTLTVVAVGRLRTLSGYTIGAGAWPEEKWSVRVARAFSEAGLATVLELEAGSFDPVLAARPAEPVALSDYLDELAAMVESSVADLPDGRILVQAVNARTLDGQIELDPAEVEAPPTWEQWLPNANVVEVKYGPDGSSSVAQQDDASIALYGPIRETYETTFKTAADASAEASSRLSRRAYARWSIATAPLLHGRRLPIGTPVLLSELPAASPFDPWHPIIEGWTDRIVSNYQELTWTMELALSDPLLSGLALLWAEVPAGVKWATVDPAATWAEALTLEDIT